MLRIGLPDAFPHKYGVQEELFEVYGMAPEQIAARVAKSLGSPREGCLSDA